MLKRLEFHHTPKHASWLNMVEIEIGVLRSQCLDRRIESTDRLVAEIDAWQTERNQSALESTGCSPPTKPEPKWPAPIPIPRSKSHNLCAAELVGPYGTIFPSPTPPLKVGSQADPAASQFSLRATADGSKGAGADNSEMAYIGFFSRGLGSAGITRPRRDYAPVRLPLKAANP